MSQSPRVAPTSFSRLARRAFAPVSIAPLVWFRIAFGLIMTVEIARFFAHGWIERYYVEPGFHFKYFGFGWVNPWPGAGMQLHFLVLGALALCIAAGWFYRWASVLFFFGFTYVFLLDQARYLNHFYLVCLYAFLLAVVPAERAFSLDAWRRPASRRAWAPAWSLWLLRAQICVVYFFGGVAKLNADWLHGEPLRTWLARRAEYYAAGSWLSHEWMVQFFTFGGLFFDLGIVPLLLWRRTRWVAFGLAAAFNLTNAWLFDIGIFPWLAIGATFLLFAPNLPRPLPVLWGAPPPPENPAPRRASLTLALVGAYVVIQVGVPLRHWLYPGDVQWTEEGHRFSWRMKLRSKAARFTLYAHDPDSNQTWRVVDALYINPLQRAQAAGRPDMILQLCHYVADDFRQQGFAHIQVRAHVAASLNGRAEQALVDPEVDLAAQPRALTHAPWITPLTTPLSDRYKPPADETADAPVETEHEK